MVDKCASHDACFGEIKSQLHSLKENQNNMRGDVVRLHQRIDNAEESSRKADKEYSDNLHKFQVRVSWILGGFAVWVTLVQVVIGSIVATYVKGVFGG